MSGQTPSHSRNLRQVMAQHPLFFFFLIAYAFSWIMSIPYILGQWNVWQGNFMIIFAIKSFGPCLAGFIMFGVTEGKAGVLALRKRCVQVRAGWQWYLFILVGIPALSLLGILILPGALASFQGFPPHFPFVYLVSFVLIFFAGGPLGEEPGWRGFALPRMQPRYGALRGTLLLGILWTCWHLPDFLTDAQRGGPGTDLTRLLTVNFPIFLVMVVAMAVIFTWVFNHTGGSVFMAMLLHTSINTFGIVQPLFTAPSVVNTDLFMCISFVVPAVLVIVFTRGQLGYKPGADQPQAAGAEVLPAA
ncbi:MAG: CPBP family intramembrane metalloprotease [Ardenticatenaceae bacterium]|nr:CPBP family intramembrane metalloprotease [Ardenticatenaceae bacterium]